MYHISKAQRSVHHFPFDEKEGKDPNNLGLTKTITDTDEHFHSNFASRLVQVPHIPKVFIDGQKIKNEGYQLPKEHRRAMEEKEAYRAQHVTYLKKITKKTSRPLQLLR
ncbi:hypothetical protein NE237_007861 [Protea cynaroides]|uniref:Uncharacterized protein n=1 Tax=Protea cynaroides TaxID=273540 RepID=A0A9Q0KQ82_9MAGN|nr:hypothetical protein NE237_007861 [Protea cynaroides]